ncbi:flavin monoamine oxidase family protein [Limnobacter alexandrii]|uniref:flavin monoamine oxidase family protein n=1 Tax=Limnobacter alexandrii TaxID=2570352 RepID=UPI001486ED1B|nr:FAD-dependent oxidoreductase [Limnobacter alexandrii]
MNSLWDAIVIGAGFSGLNAARTLRSHGKNALVLEARDRVGGRTKHGQIAGLDIDLGGMWLAPSQTRLFALADTMGIGRYPTFLKGKSVLSMAGKQGVVNGEDFTQLLSLREKIQAYLLLRKLNHLLSTVNDADPWNSVNSSELDSLSVEAWLCKATGSERLRALIRVICASVFCAEAPQVSMLFFLVYLKGGGGLEAMISADEGGGQNLLFHGGVHQIARNMAQELGDHLHLNEAVHSIDVSSTEAVVATGLAQYRAKRVIVAVPPTLMNRINITPPLPSAQAALHNRVNMGSVIKFWVAYPTPFWRQQGFNGSIVRDDKPASPCFDVSPPDSPLGLIAGFFEADHAVHIGDSSKEQRREHVVDMLAEHFGEQALNPVDYVDEDWTQEEWSKGCYGAFAPPGVMTHYGEWIRTPHHTIHWAGTETATEWAGYIEGALQAGERAAREVLEGLANDQ